MAGTQPLVDLIASGVELDAWLHLLRAYFMKNSHPRPQAVLAICTGIVWLIFFTNLRMCFCGEQPLHKSKHLININLQIVVPDCWKGSSLTLVTLLPCDSIPGIRSFFFFQWRPTCKAISIACFNSAIVACNFFLAG